ncbi:unnamed protein product [Plutella xylostella]|uniref:(diamondback moth) hypothetical protein n=1 Tax=Plutella xylostella TaxID=51655 RepID=A0A8S4D0D4_PLUXY|nr:unnamed protein product [Plutella xylostella]
MTINLKAKVKAKKIKAKVNKKVCVHQHHTWSHIVKVPPEILDVFSNDIDIRNYVQVKRLPGGVAGDSRVLPGVVTGKNVAHRGMPQEIANPSILLLDCSIAYQRVEGKLTSLEPVLLQEKEYLLRCAARITALRPKVVLVRGTAARAVQDVLRNEGVALATCVRERALARTARCTGADIATSIDARIVRPRLGTCRSFRVETHANKTLMILENCAEPNLGCCILLRGGSLAELTKVKKVVKFLLLAYYNWKLERAFLHDIETVLPEPGMNFDDLDDEETKDKTTNDEDNKSAKLETDNQNDPTEKKSVKLETDNQKVEDKDDPLQKKPFVRKVESDKNLSCGVPIRDFSDPLRASQLGSDDEVFAPVEEASLKADSLNDR